MSKKIIENKQVIEKIDSEILRAHAKYGSADLKKVVNKVVGNFPELRADVKELINIIKQEIEKFSNISKEKAIKMLAEKGVEISKPKQDDKELKLIGDTRNVVMRLAPNPSGPLHFGNARMIVLNSFLTKKYNGKLICRIEDTDPERVYPPAYDMVLDDLKNFGVEYDEIVYQSDRWDIYYKLCEQLISQGKAYVCTCPSEEFSKLKQQGKYCSCRKRAIQENLDLFHNTNLEKSAVVRFKTTLTNNPALREFPLMRFKKAKHPRKNNPYNWYPMMNFAVAVDDYLLGITYVLRGMDHLTNTEIQKMIYDSFSWNKPVFMLYGTLNLKGIELSKSKITKGVSTGLYSGFDDPRLWTLRALFRRGIQPQAIKNYLLSIGITKNNINFDEKALYKENTKIIEPICTHLFFVEDPIKLEIEKYTGPNTLELPVNPKNPSLGARRLNINTNNILISKMDFEDIKNNEIFRLKDGFNARKQDNKLIFENMHLPNLKNEIKLNKIQWLPDNKENIACHILMPDGTTKKGLVEPFASHLKVGDIVQFERVGYARIDKIEKDLMVAVFGY